MSKSAEVKRWLRSLGRTPSEIRHRLGRFYIQGHRRNARQCPLACVLSVMYPTERVRVYSDQIEVGKAIITLPKAVEHFVENFDSGLYSNLNRFGP